MNAADASVSVGDIVKMKKTHPCGSDTWTVIRTGADVKIKCGGCGRIVMMDRFVFIKRRKAIITSGSQNDITQSSKE
ncbi:MAG: DUF951 domain-containing protein [Oscillospiraceae bacterium]|jgi:hypothetical protein|nr:DUF951 domain-containing protein [Oscillospiraceae bacterium]